jgi:DNA adenine methylase
MRPIFCRTGSKYLMADDILAYFPKHLIYVEPFFGGGSMYWKKEPSPAEIINDLDAGLMNDYKLIKKASSDTTKYKQELNTIDKIVNFLKQNHITNEDKLTESIIRRCNGFGGDYIKKQRVSHKSNPYAKIKNIEFYKNRIKKTIIKNLDYKKIIYDYDSKDTFFYLDPPYENSETVYILHSINYEEMANMLKNIKGKFLLSINGSRYIKKVFGDFKIKQITKKTYASPNTKLIGGKPRIELLIYNF